MFSPGAGGQGAGCAGAPLTLPAGKYISVSAGPRCDSWRRQRCLAFLPGREPHPGRHQKAADLPVSTEEEHLVDNISITVTGRLGNAPTQGTTSGGKAWASF
jgi:hypothetical protein